MVLDTSYLYFRAFFGVPDSVRAPDGMPVNAVHGLLDTMTRLVTEHRPERLVAAWDDDWRPAFRVHAIPSYKAHRVAGERPDGGWIEEVPPALTAQVPLIADVLAALGVARLGVPGFEADDVMGTLVTRAQADGEPVDVVSGDRDLFQLVDDEARVRVLYPSKEGFGPVDQAELTRRYGIATGAQYADMAVLRGDPSDGLPGVPGIGEKTAASLVVRYGDLAGVLAARDRADAGLTATLLGRLTEAAAYLDAAPGVVRVERDAPVPAVDDHLPPRSADPVALDAFVARWGMGGAVRRLLAALSL
ncbi:MAG TPA: 5'-3' exonuclease [Cellulomonas sp.]